MHNEFAHTLGLLQIKGIGDILTGKLISHFGSAQNVFAATTSDLKNVEGIDQTRLNAIKKGFDKKLIDQELNFIEKNNIQFHLKTDDTYPILLKEINDAPYIVYSKGTCSLNINRAIAIVGSRKNTAIGKQFTEELIANLKHYQPCIVSGLAYGIDIIAHKAAIENNIPTIGVLAHGLDRIYPSDHHITAKRMMEHGALLTEYTSGTNPDKQNFPSRNRIVAGMCNATLVIETDVKGGAMITAKLALSYNRDVFALPGRYNDLRSAGCNYLIKTNIAQLVTSASDIASFLNWDDDKNNKKQLLQQKLFQSFNEEELKIITILQQKELTHVDELQIKTGFSSSVLAALLLQLEFNGSITAFPGKRYTSNA